MVKAADALWDAQGGHDPTVAATLTQRSRSLAPSSGRRGARAVAAAGIGEVKSSRDMLASSEKVGKVQRFDGHSSQEE
jgi:hypothetical protein